MAAAPPLTLVGHLTVDAFGERRRLGGAVVYGALAARRLGLVPRVVTAGRRVDAELLLGLDVAVRLFERPVSTEFEHVGAGSGRQLRVTEWAGPIPLAALPEGDVLLAPVARELPAFPARAEDGRLVALAAQGALREWGSGGLVREVRVDALPARADVVFASRAEAPGLPPRGDATLVITDGPREVEVRAGSRTLTLVPPGLELADDVGAGDVFAVGCVAALLTGAAPLDAVRAGHAAVRDHLPAVQAELNAAGAPA